MKIVLATVVAAAAAVGAAAPAMAQDVSFSGAYGNLGWSQTDTHGADTQNIQGRVGARFGRFLGVEGEVSAGLGGGHQWDDNTSPSTRVGVKQDVAGAGYVVGFLPVTHKFDLLARVGYGASDYDIKPAGAASYHVGENGVRFGGGGQYFLDGKNGIRVDWTREHMGNFTDGPGYFPGDRNADVVSVAFAHRF